MSKNQGWKLGAGWDKGCVTSFTKMLVEGSESPRCHGIVPQLKHLEKFTQSGRSYVEDERGDVGWESVREGRWGGEVKEKG